MGDWELLLLRGLGMGGDNISDALRCPALLLYVYASESGWSYGMLHPLQPDSDSRSPSHVYLDVMYRNDDNTPCVSLLLLIYER